MERVPSDDVRIAFNVADYLSDDAEVTADEARLIADIAARKPVSRRWLERLLDVRGEAFPQEKSDWAWDVENRGKIGEKPTTLVIDLFRSRLRTRDFGSEIGQKN